MKKVKFTEALYVAATGVTYKKNQEAEVDDAFAEKHEKGGRLKIIAQQARSTSKPADSANTAKQQA